MTEEMLLHSLKLGLPAAYDQLYERYWKMLYTKAFGRLKDEELAKDAVQEVFISLWQKRESLSLSSTLENYLLGAVRFQVLNCFRYEKVKESVLQRVLLQMEMLTSTDMSEDHDISEEMREQLDQLLQRMPPKMRTSFLLRCDNRSIKEIATHLNVNEQTVSNYLSEAVKFVRHHMNKATNKQAFMSIGVLLLLLNN